VSIPVSLVVTSDGVSTGEAISVTYISSVASFASEHASDTSSDTSSDTGSEPAQSANASDSVVAVISTHSVACGFSMVTESQARDIDSAMLAVHSMPLTMSSIKPDAKCSMTGVAMAFAIAAESFETSDASAVCASVASVNSCAVSGTMSAIDSSLKAPMAAVQAAESDSMTSVKAVAVADSVAVVSVRGDVVALVPAPLRGVVAHVLQLGLLQLVHVVRHVVVVGHHLWSLDDRLWLMEDDWRLMDDHCGSVHEHWRLVDDH